MARSVRKKHERLLTQAEGYLELGMPERALDVLEAVGSGKSAPVAANYLRGLALRDLQRYREAIEPLQQAAEEAPAHVGIRLALGWCFKRTEQLPRAIEVLQQARRAEPDNALVQYNLACYQSLAGHRNAALEMLARALEIDSGLRHLISDESDFDSLRGDPLFENIVQAAGADSSTQRNS